MSEAIIDDDVDWWEYPNYFENVVFKPECVL